MLVNIRLIAENYEYDARRLSTRLSHWSRLSEDLCATSRGTDIDDNEGDVDNNDDDHHVHDDNDDDDDDDDDVDNDDDGNNDDDADDVQRL